MCKNTFLSEQIESVKKIGPLPLCIGWNISGINGLEVLLNMKVSDINGCTALCVCVFHGLCVGASNECWCVYLCINESRVKCLSAAV